MRASLAGTGLVATAIGIRQAVSLLGDIINESQGKCDYVPCVWPWTYPSLAAFLLLALRGVSLVAWTSFSRRRNKSSIPPTDVA